MIIFIKPIPEPASGNEHDQARETGELFGRLDAVAAGPHLLQQGQSLGFGVWGSHLKGLPRAKKVWKNLHDLRQAPCSF